MSGSTVQLGSDAGKESQHEALLRQLLERAAPYLKRIGDEQGHELEIERAIWGKLHPGEDGPQQHETFCAGQPTSPPRQNVYF